MLKRPLQTHWLHFTLMIWEWHWWIKTYTHAHKDTHTFIHDIHTKTHRPSSSFIFWACRVQSVTNLHPQTHRHTNTVFCVLCMLSSRDNKVWQSRVLWPGQTPNLLLPVQQAQDQQHDKQGLFCYFLSHPSLSVVEDTHALKLTGRNSAKHIITNIVSLLDSLETQLNVELKHWTRVLLMCYSQTSTNRQFYNSFW